MDASSGSIYTLHCLRIQLHKMAVMMVQTNGMYELITIRDLSKR